MVRPWSLVILAAGLGSRFGGNKQVSQFSPSKVTLMELNIFAAHSQGVREVIFIVTAEVKQFIKSEICNLLPQDLQCQFVIQDKNDLPVQMDNVYERVKPWGTAHALWCCRHLLKNPFAVINADDFYGVDAFVKASEHFESIDHWGMVAFSLKNTLSKFGGVNRGVCKLNSQSQLVQVNEVTAIAYNQGLQLIGMSKEKSIELAEDDMVSMNFWLLTTDVFGVLQQNMESFFHALDDINEGECQLPDAIDLGIKSFEHKVQVHLSDDNWFGLTYAKDKGSVALAVNKEIQHYPYKQYVDTRQ